MAEIIETEFGIRAPQATLVERRNKDRLGHVFCNLRLIIVPGGTHKGTGSMCASSQPAGALPATAGEGGREGTAKGRGGSRRRRAGGKPVSWRKFSGWRVAVKGKGARPEVSWNRWLRSQGLSTNLATGNPHSHTLHGLPLPSVPHPGAREGTCAFKQAAMKETACIKTWVE